MRKTEWIVTILIVILLVPAFYSIFNVGNPDSIFRVIIKDSAYDLFLTVALCAMIGILSVVLYSLRLKNQSPIIFILNSNLEYIKFLRKNGKTNEEIADSFLNELGKGSGLLFKVPKKRVIKYLDELDKNDGELS